MFSDRPNGLVEPPAPPMPLAGMPGAPGGEAEVHLLDRLSILYRYRKIVLSVVLLVLLAGVVQTYTTTPEYEAVAWVRVEDDRPLTQSLASAYRQDTAEVIAGQINVLKSRDLAKGVVGKLGLADRPEFNGLGGEPTGLGAMFGSIRARVMRPIRSLFGRAEPAPPAAPPTPAVAAAEQAAAAATEAEDREANLVSAFLDHLDARPFEGAPQITVHFVSSDPLFAARAANALVDEFVAQNHLLKTASVSNSITVLDDTIKSMTETITKTSAEMEKFRTDQKAEALLDLSYLQNQVQQHKNDAARLRVDREIAEIEYNAVKDFKPEDPALDAFPVISNDGQISQLNVKRNALKYELDGLLVRVGREHETVRSKQREIDNTMADLRARKSQLIDILRRNYDSKRRLELATVNLQRDAENMQADMGKKGLGYGYLVQQLQNSQGLLQDLMKERQVQTVQQSATKNNVSVMDRAITPLKPFKPDVSRNLITALLVGIVLAGVAAFGLDYLDDTVKTPEDITRKLRIPFLGLVPSVRGDKQPVLSGPVPHDFGEAYRALRTSLVFTSGGETTRMITVTSAQPLEGKTTTACNLAMVLAFGGSRVLLIDADMRRPGVHKALKINNTVGLSHLLVGQARVREAIQRTSDPNFCVMTAGRTPPNPSELLASERMKQLIANLKQGPFDWVVIDTPPVLAVTDAVILTPLVDGVTFVLGAEMTRRRLAERAVQMLMVSRPKVVGAVLNRVNFDRNKYYYSRYYGYQYKSYYGAGSSSTAKG